MDTVTDSLSEARAAWRRGDWRASRAAYVRVDGFGSMPLDDLDAYATATWRIGDDGEAVRLAERVYDRLVRTDPAAAARKAADVALEWHIRGHAVVARAWVERARAPLAGDATVVAGYLTYLDASAAAAATDRAALVQSASVLRDIGVRGADPALDVLGRVVAGLAALLDGRPDEGVRILDGVLVPVIDDSVPLEWACDVYRTVLASAEGVVDADRRARWTRSLVSWCDTRGIAAELVTGARR